MPKILDIKIFNHRTDDQIISGMEDQIISLGFAVQNMRKEGRKCTVCSKCLEKCRLKSRGTHNDVQSNTVIKNTDTVFCIWRDNADVAFF